MCLSYQRYVEYMAQPTLFGSGIRNLRATWSRLNLSSQTLIFAIGFDEYMNVVVDEAEEIYVKTLNRNKLGRILLKGDNITLIQTVQ